ncbi:cysteine hydrolase family protein [Chromobacterium sp. IIBBL 290-4]|uniref:cysteine hydrolase family protein n=1 Tax=Chromobacterium sp. IIBBL 290-4 TaxID=2953890 RepID=UPI0020B8CCFB|nr:cysteine hydrolase family protein [Chromobacterium sp. IIBBL 290-4]UTH74403.1 cysteine hydrolase [Chromobacterium sp. IIBBL 290-4]
MQTQARTALLIIDLQNDYFPGGKYPLANTAAALDNSLRAIAQARAQNMPVILVQHVAASAASPFFAPDSEGVRIHPQVLAAAPDAPVVIKQHADSFLNTDLSALLQKLEINTLLIGGMMTQNCVTHTALSRAADPYQVSVLQDCCATVDGMVHAIALRALGDKVPLLDGQAAWM